MFHFVDRHSHFVASIMVNILGLDVFCEKMVRRKMHHAQFAGLAHQACFNNPFQAARAMPKWNCKQEQAKIVVKKRRLTDFRAFAEIVSQKNGSCELDIAVAPFGHEFLAPPRRAACTLLFVDDSGHVEGGIEAAVKVASL